MRLVRLALTAMPLLLSAATPVIGDELSDRYADIEYQWQLSDPEAQHLFEQAKLLRYGDLLSQVKGALGSPTEEGTLADKAGKKPRKYLTYAVKRVRPQGGNTNDQEILLLFDMQDHLLSIDYQSMRPLGVQGTAVSDWSVEGIELYSTKPPPR